MNIDLETMSLKDMKDLRTKLDRAISTYEDRKRRQAIAAAEEVAKEHGFNLAELASGSKPRKTGTVAPKYANPDDATMTWTGRGRKPRWVVDALDSGKALDDLLI